MQYFSGTWFDFSTWMPKNFFFLSLKLFTALSALCLCQLFNISPPLPPPYIVWSSSLWNPFSFSWYTVPSLSYILVYLSSIGFFFFLLQSLVILDFLSFRIHFLVICTHSDSLKNILFIFSSLLHFKIMLFWSSIFLAMQFPFHHILIFYCPWAVVSNLYLFFFFFCNVKHK